MKRFLYLWVATMLLIALLLSVTVIRQNPDIVTDVQEPAHLQTTTLSNKRAKQPAPLTRGLTRDPLQDGDTDSVSQLDPFRAEPLLDEGQQAGAHLGAVAETGLTYQG